VADVAAAKRYAQAAFELARERGDDLERWRADLDDIATVLAESPVAAILADTRRPVDERTAFADRALDVQPLALNLARLLISKGRSLDARAVAQAFGRLADEAEGVAQATVTAAIELSPEQVRDLEQRLGEALDRRVTATATVDPEIIGGLVVRVGDRLVDGSVRSRLKRLREELAGTA